MEEKKTIFDYIGQVFGTFGFTMICMMCFAIVFGESAKEYSEFFALGNAGITVSVMFQYLLLSIIIVFLRYLFFTDKIIKHLSAVTRTAFMLLAILITIVMCIILFDWFPVYMWQPWAMFGLCFAICFIVSTVVTRMKINLEDKRLAEGLSKLKQKWEDEEDE